MDREDSVLSDTIEDALNATRNEIGKAFAKFPTWPSDPFHAYGVLAEEFGELGKAIVQHVYEPHRTDFAEVRKEAEQCAAMAIRFLASLDRYDFDPCHQHEQGNG